MAEIYQVPSIFEQVKIKYVNAVGASHFFKVPYKIYPGNLRTFSVGTSGPKCYHCDTVVSNYQDCQTTKVCAPGEVGNVFRQHSDISDTTFRCVALTYFVLSRGKLTLNYVNLKC